MDRGTNIALVPLDGDLDVTSAPALRAAIDSLLGEGCLRIVLNMANASFIDSAGVGLILCETRRMRERGGLLSLVNVHDRVLRSLTLARIVDFVPVSVAGERAGVSELEPTAQPLWRSARMIDPSSLHDARAHVERQLRRTGLCADAVFDMTLAAGEAMGNAVDHACGCMVVTVSCYQDRAIVDVTDCGDGFEPSEGDASALGSAGERGRGIALMRLLADAVTIAPKPSGAGTVVRIVKLLR